MDPGLVGCLKGFGKASGCLTRTSGLGWDNSKPRLGSGIKSCVNDDLIIRHYRHAGASVELVIKTEVVIKFTALKLL